jgi:uncharacterized protein RhaS with RHS repeats
MGVRYYSSTMGRFTRPDPIQTSGFEHMHDPQAWNGYAYVRNNPLVYVDPDGLDYHVCDTSGKNCSNLTDDQYKQFLKDSPNVHEGANGSLYYSAPGVDPQQIGSANYFNPSDIAGAQLLGNTGRQLSDPRTIAAWYGLSALGGFGLYGAGAFEGGALTTVELSASTGEILTNQAAGQIIGWGTGQEGAAATEQLTNSLTEKGVQQMIDKGLTKATVQRLVFQYGRAIAEGGAKLANSQLLPRYQLMMKIVNLCPK